MASIMDSKAVRNKLFAVASLFVWVASAISCEVPTKLSMREGLPPTFLVTGNGILTSIRVRGPNKQRDAMGEDQYLYWVIELKDYDGSQVVGRLGSVKYGEIPKGYVQIYPENGATPPLNENEHYSVHFVTTDAPHDDGYFMVHDGRVVFAKYEYQLSEK
jgi:hypothetical protein